MAAGSSITGASTTHGGATKPEGRGALVLEQGNPSWFYPDLPPGLRSIDPGMFDPGL